MQFETDQGAVGSTVISQISADRTNCLWLEIDGGEEALQFCQEEPEDLWLGRRESVTIVKRDPEHMSAAAQRYAGFRPPTCRATRTASTPSRRRVTTRSSSGAGCRRSAGARRRPAGGLPGSPTPCCGPAREDRWVDVSIEAAWSLRMSESTAPLLEVRGITKQYPGVSGPEGHGLRRAGRGSALPARPERRRQVDADQGASRGVHALTEGQILIEGELLTVGEPSQSMALGIGTIYQELDLVEDLRVAESVFLGHEPRRLGRPGPREDARRHDRAAPAPRARRHQAGHVRAPAAPRRAADRLDRACSCRAT